MPKRKRGYIQSKPPKPSVIVHVASGNYCEHLSEATPLDHTLQTYTTFPSRRQARKALGKIIPHLPPKGGAGEAPMYQVKIL
jgi:hypothetical protein